MNNQEILPNTRTKIALWGTVVALAITGSGCGENDDNKPDSQTASPVAQAPSNTASPLECSDKSYVTKQGELIRIELDDDYRINVVNAGIAYGAHLISATLVDQQTDKNVNSQMSNNLEAIDFVRTLPETGEPSETIYRVLPESVPGNTQEASITLCSQNPNDLSATWEHVRDNAFSIIQPPTTPSANQPPTNSQI